MKIKVGAIIKVACEEGDILSRILRIDAPSREVDVVVLDPDDLSHTDETIENCPFSSLRIAEGVGPVEPPPVVAPTKNSGGGVGFNQYLVKWTDINFRFETRDPSCEFYGQWRRTLFMPHRVPGFAIDMWAHFSGRDFSVDSVFYHEDPRLDLRSLEADLCAMANRFLYGRLSGEIDRIEDLVKRAEKPLVKITNLQTLDSIILRLNELRQTAITAGGQRFFVFPKDPKDESSSEVTLQINLTREATMYAMSDSRPPAPNYGRSYIGEDGQRSKIAVDSSTIESMVERLRKTSDPKEQRRIRGVLRKLGHRGGSRTLGGSDS